MLLEIKVMQTEIKLFYGLSKGHMKSI